MVAGDPGTSLAEVRFGIDKAAIGKAMHDLVAELYAICRSITGDGVRETLSHIARRVPITVHEVPTGTRAFDWEIPPEWNIRDAWVKDAHGRRVIDFREHNLHVMSYSEPVRTHLTRDELERRVFTLPDHPQWIPYRTSYYERNWGFCAPHDTLASLPDGDYEVCIDSTLEAGSLTYGEVLLGGATEAEVLLSTHICHPSLANDNLSGIALGVLAAEHLQRVQLRYSYRILFIPGTIGSIAWLARNEANVERVQHGLVVAGVGDPGPYTYKRSRRGTRPSIERSSTCSRHPETNTWSSTGPRTATTSDSSARLGSTCPSAGSAVRRTVNTPSTTRLPTTSTSCGRSRWPSPFRPC